jgi:hypothetical protein
MSSHLVHAVFHRGKALRRRVSTGVHLVHLESNIVLVVHPESCHDRV